MVWLVAIELVTRTSVGNSNFRNETGLYRLLTWSILQRLNFESHASQISQYPGESHIYAKRTYAGNRTWVDQKCLPSFDIGLPKNLSEMNTASAPTACACITAARNSARSWLSETIQIFIVILSRFRKTYC